MLWFYCSSLPSPVLVRPGTGFYGSGRVALGFVVVAVISALYALGYIAALWLRKLGSGLRALGALVSVRHRQPFAKTTTIALSEAKEEVS